MTGPLLVIDAATYRGTAALVDGTHVIAETDAQMRGVTEERLMPAVAALLQGARVPVTQLAGVVCGDGPGSFTSLRIAASIAKGIVTAGGQPLMAVSSLLLVVAGDTAAARPGRYLAMLDAMRGEWFAARTSVSDRGVPALDGDVEIVDATTVARILRDEGRVSIGPGQRIDVAPHARGVAQLVASNGALRPVDPATWEPSYGRLAEAQARWEKSHGRPLVA
jgi:tRNA threonylcarbamoyladenosine biosynthesis protein TsaB